MGDKYKHHPSSSSGGKNEHAKSNGTAIREAKRISQ